MIALVLEHGIEFARRCRLEQAAAHSHPRCQRPVREREALLRVDEDNAAVQPGAARRVRELVRGLERKLRDPPSEPPRGSYLARDGPDPEHRTGSDQRDEDDRRPQRMAAARQSA